MSDSRRCTASATSCAGEVSVHRLTSLPLRWRLTLAATGVLAVALALFGTVLYLKLEQSLVATTAQGLRLSAQPAIDTWVKPPKSPKAGQATLPSANEPSDAAKPLRDLAQRLTTDVTAALALSTTGALVADGPALTGNTTVPAPRLDPAVYRAVAASGQERSLQQPTSTGPVLIELIPLRQSGAVTGILQVSTPLRTVDSFLRTLRLVLAVGAFIAIAATVLVTVPLVRGVLRPLRRMAVTSRAIAAGDLGLRVPVPSGADELSELAEAFNEMVGRLAAMLATQRRFLADASHELRTPLTALGGGIDVLLLGTERGDPADRLRLLRLMEGEAARMGRLVDDLLALARFDADPEHALALAPVDLGALATEVAAATRLLAPDRTVSVSVATEPGTAIIIPGDVDRLRQALLNVCANARTYTPAGGAIAIEVRRLGTEATITVADTGTGIEAADLPRVWDRFYRADLARARRAGAAGLGLGLAIVRAIIVAHGGRASIASAPGVGTTVTLALPGATTGPASEPEQQLIAFRAAGTTG